MTTREVDPRSHHEVEADVTIQRPSSEVFTFYRDLRNLPKFLGDVWEVEPTGAMTYRWTVEGPGGVRLHWDVEVTEVVPDALVRYRTKPMAGVTAEWTTTFTPAPDGATRVHEALSMPMERLTSALLALVGKPPQAEVQANLRRLKELLETGRVSDTEHAVKGKFPTGVPQS